MILKIPIIILGKSVWKSAWDAYKRKDGRKIKFKNSLQLNLLGQKMINQLKKDIKSMMRNHKE